MRRNPQASARHRASHHASLFTCLFALLALAIAPRVSHAADAGGYTTRALGYTMTSIDGYNADGTDSGYLTQGNATAFASSDRTVGQRFASADADTIVSMGSLSIRLETRAYSPAADQFTMGHTEAEAYFTDLLTIASETLPVGTPVVLQYRSLIGLDVNTQLTGPGDPQSPDLEPDVATTNYTLFGSSYPAAGGAPLDYLSHSHAGFLDSDQVSTVNAEVGGTIAIEASFLAKLTSRAGNGTAGFTHAVIDASSAARVAFTPLGDDFTFYANSNAAYHLPEPAAITALPAALMLVLRHRRRMSHRWGTDSHR